MGSGLLTIGVSYSARMREEHIGEYYALLATACAGMAFLVQAGNLMTLFLGPRVVLGLPLHPVRDRDRPRRLARGRAQVPDHRRDGLGGAALRLGAHLRLDRRARLRGDRRRDERRRPRRRPDPARRARDDPGRPGVQGLGRAVPHVDARRLRGRADPGDGLHGGRDEGGRARPHPPGPDRGLSRERGRLDDRGRRPRLHLARLGQHRRARPAARQAAPGVLVDLARRVHADRDRRRRTSSAAGRSSTT